MRGEKLPLTQQSHYGMELFHVDSFLEINVCLFEDDFLL